MCRCISVDRATDAGELKNPGDHDEDDREGDRCGQAVEDAGRSHAREADDDPERLREAARETRHEERAHDEADGRQPLLQAVLELRGAELSDREGQQQDVPQAEREEHERGDQEQGANDGCPPQRSHAGTQVRDDHPDVRLVLRFRHRVATHQGDQPRADQE